MVRFHRSIAAAVVRTANRLGDSSKALVDDLVQETYLKLCADNCRILRDLVQNLEVQNLDGQNLGEPNPDIQNLDEKNLDDKSSESVNGFIKVLASNIVRDYFKSRYSQKRGRGRTTQFPDGFSPKMPDKDSSSARSIERAVLLAQIQTHLVATLAGPDQQRNVRMFWLHYSSGLSASSIAALAGIGLSSKGVETALRRMTRGLRNKLTKSTQSEGEKRGDPGEGICMQNIVIEE